MNNTAQLALAAQTIESSDGCGKEMLMTAKAQMGFVPNMYANMVHSPGLLEAYLLGYNRFRAESGFSPVEQEVVLLTISRFNACTYCMAAHSMIADKMSKVPANVLEAVRNGTPIADRKLTALATFTKAMFTTRGQPSAADMKAFIDAGYSEPQALEIVLALAVKTLSNYANHLFHTEVDTMFAGYRIPNAA